MLSSCPFISKHDLDYQLVNSLVTEESNSTHISQANHWGYSVFQNEFNGNMDIPLQLLNDTNANLLASGSIAPFLKNHILPLLPHDCISLSSIHSVYGSLQSMILSNNFPDKSKFAIPIDWGQFLLDIDIIQDFVTNGIPIFTDPSFVPISKVGPCSRGYFLAMPAINAHILSNCKKGLGFIVSQEIASKVLVIH